jgi:GT2 family glycosyltransferase
MSDPRAMRVTIVAACRNEIGHLRGFVDSILAQQTDDMILEAIVADGMSTDGTRELLDDYASRFPNLRVISNPQKIVSTGLNAAIRAARGEIILRMDAHTHYAADYTRLCVKTLLETGADNVGGPARTTARGTIAQAVAAAYHSPFSTGGARFHDENYEGWVDTVTYGCWKKETLERIGLFDETLVRNQDDELNLRLLRNGGGIWQNPAIVSVYSPRATISGLFGQYFQYGFWKVAVIRKHRRPGSWRHLVPALFVLGHLGLAVVVVICALAAARRGLLIAGTLWLLLIGAYATANAFASLLAARRQWKTLVFLPVVFSAYHLSYGFGFLIGMLRSSSKWHGTSAGESVFARITR